MFCCRMLLLSRISGCGDAKWLGELKDTYLVAPNQHLQPQLTGKKQVDGRRADDPSTVAFVTMVVSQS